MIKTIFRTVDLRGDVRAALQEFFDTYLKPDMEVYDIGCGSKPFQSALDGKVKNYIGVDIEDGFYDSSHIDIFGTAYDVPIEENTADAIISSQVLEHLERPADAIKEAARILKQDGVALISFPFLYPLHAEPHDYSRITEFQAKKMLDENNFEMIELKRIGGFWYIAGMYASLYFQPFDRGILNTLKIAPAFLFLVRWFFYQLHRIEGAALKLFGKSTENLRRKWTVNYVLAVRKKEA